MPLSPRDLEQTVPVVRPFAAFRSHFHIALTRSTLWRLVMVFLMVTTFVVGMWAGIASPAAVAFAASVNSPAGISVDTSGTSSPVTRFQPHSKQPPITHAKPIQVNSSQPFDGLGVLPFYTYIKFPIDDRVEALVNVANGNLVVHTTDLHITGTGIDESLEAYYNSQASFSRDHGNNWNFSFGHDVRLDLSNPTQGITLHGPTGYSAFFAYNSQTQTYTDPSGLNATLVANQDGTYTLTLHNTGEQLVFGTNSHEAADKDKNGNTISYSYDSSHDLLSLTDTQGRVTTFDHNTVAGFTDPSGQLIKVIDPSGRVIKYGYNGNGNPTNSFTSLTDASGAVTTFNYSGGDLISITDPLGNTTQITYLNGDKVGTITDATGKGTITFTYNSGNTVVTDRNGNTTTYTYNQQLQVTKVTDPLGHNESTSYDANYDVTQYMDDLSDQTNFVFNTGTNTLHSAADGNKATTTFTYPTPGSQNQYYPLSQNDPQNNTTNYAYDSNGNLLSATNKSTNTGLTYTYNSNGTIHTQTDADGNVATFGYDSEGNLTSVTPPSTLGKTTLVVDPQTSRVKSVTDGNGNKTSYSYDALDRITKITYNSGATISYNFDGNGNLTSEIDNTGTTSFTYDVLNRITKKSLPDGVVFTTGYDKNGNLTSFNDGGGAVTYQYDAANRMTILTDTDGSQTIYSYDNANRKTMIQYPNSTGMRMTYDAAGHELTAIGGTMDSQGNIETTYSSFTYTYTAGSSPTQLVQTVTFLDPVNWSSGTYYTRDYSYDSQNRLVDADVYYKGGTQEIQGWDYSYDAAGNRTSFSQVSPAITASYTYQAGNELTAATVNGQTTNYSYDGNGNLTGVTPGGPSLNYNGKNQTTSIGSNNYTYSGPAQTDRVQINSTTLDYSGLGLSRQEDSSGTTHFVRCSCGLLNNERLPSGNRFYYLFDGLGSIVGMTSGADGSKTNSYDYDPTGVMLNETQGKPNPWQYAGGYLDASGYYQFGTRYYDPTLGRWTQQDPVAGSLADAQGLNRYVFVGDDPVNYVDPSGEALTIGCIIGLVGAVTNGILIAFTVVSPVILAALAVGATLSVIISSVVIALVAFLYAVAVFVAAILYCSGIP